MQRLTQHAVRSRKLGAEGGAGHSGSALDTNTILVGGWPDWNSNVKCPVTALLLVFNSTCSPIWSHLHKSTPSPCCQFPFRALSSARVVAAPCGTMSMAAAHGLSQGHQVNLGSLAVDILFEVIDHLSVPDVLRFRQVCNPVFSLENPAPNPFHRSAARGCPEAASPPTQTRRVFLVPFRPWIATGHHVHARSASLSIFTTKPYIIESAPRGRYVVAATRNTRDGIFGVVIWGLGDTEYTNGVGAISNTHSSVLPSR